MTSKSHRIIQTSLHSYMESKNPMKLFEMWYCDACKNPAVQIPSSMSIATVKNNGRPFAQIVKMHEYDNTGFKFLSNDSHLKKIGGSNTYAALVLYWELLNRQIRVEGVIEKLPQRESGDWDSFVVKPERFEFWQHQSRSMHDRVVFTQQQSLQEEELWYDGEEGWNYQWLEP